MSSNIATHRTIFLSYSRSDSDREFARKLASDLCEGLLDDQAVFYDKKSLDLASLDSPFNSVVREALIQSDLFLVILSRDALNSEPLRREIQLALEQGKETIIGLQRELCSIPVFLQNRPIVSFMPPVDYDDGLAELHGLLLEAMEGRKQTGVSDDSEGWRWALTGQGKSKPAMLLSLIPTSVLEHVVNASQSPNCMIEEYLKNLQQQELDQQALQVCEAEIPDFAAYDSDRHWLDLPDPLASGKERTLVDEEPPQSVTHIRKRLDPHQFVLTTLKALFVCVSHIRVLLASSLRRGSAWLDQVIQVVQAIAVQGMRHVMSVMSSLGTSTPLWVKRSIQAAWAISRSACGASRALRLIRFDRHKVVDSDGVLCPMTWDSYLAWMCKSQTQTQTQYQDFGLLYARMLFVGATTGPHLPALARGNRESMLLRLSRPVSNRAARVVLAIGVGAYDNPQLPDLPVSVRIAERIFSSCSYRNGTATTGRSHETAESIQLLTDRQASMQSIRDALRNLASQCQPDDTVAVYFAGHGRYEVIGDRARDYLCLSDTDPQDLQQTALSRDELLSSLRGLASRQILLCLDTCRSANVTWEPTWLEQLAASRCDLVSEFFNQNQFNGNGEDNLRQRQGRMVVDTVE